MSSVNDLIHKKNSIEAGNYGMPPDMQEEYRHGKSMHSGGFGIDSLSDLSPVKLAFQKAGWHDADIEAGNRRYF